MILAFKKHNKEKQYDMCDPRSPSLPIIFLLLFKSSKFSILLLVRGNIYIYIFTKI